MKRIGGISLFLSLVVIVTTSALHARDILRQSSTSTTTVGASETSSVASSAVVPASSSAQDLMARTAQAISAVQAMQTAAHTLALTGANNLGLDPNHIGLTLPNVPNGLTSGGLQPAGSADTLLWQGAKAPTQTVSGAQTTVTVTQTSEQALLSWKSFSVGKNTTINFDQSLGGANVSQWVAFNTITDPSGVPSQILGNITSQGQVYLLNGNGIIFGGSSQVNVGSLVASSLPINSNLVSIGLFNNPDQQFLFSSLSIDSGVNGTPAFNPVAALTPTGAPGSVSVQSGAILASPTTASNSGGLIALYGTSVTNAGTISTPDGQTILAAGQQIGLAPHNSADPSLRGLDVYVGSGGGTVTNASNGWLNVPFGDVSMIGKSVNQLGAISSLTSVALNGRIDLSAVYNSISGGGYSGVPAFLPQNTGTVTFGPSSITQVLPDLSDSTTTVVGTQLALASQINATGLSVYLGNNGSVIAPNGNIKFSAGNYYLTGSGAFALDQFAYTNGQIYIDTGANVNAAGSANVSASVAENVISVQLLGPELANSPLQKNGPLQGQSINIDIRQTGTYNGSPWIGTPLADTSGYVGLILRNVAELTTAGGAIQFNAGNSVVVKSGATVDVSGGWINYQGSNVNLTELVDTSGNIVPINQATPDRIYLGIYNPFDTKTNSKWGTVVTSTNPQLLTIFDPSYIQGGNGGTLSIQAPSVALQGTLTGLTRSGAYQVNTPAAPSSFNLLLAGQDLALPSFNYPFYSQYTPSLSFQASSSLPQAAGFSLSSSGIPNPLSAALQSQVILPPSILGSNGFGKVAINDSDGIITIPFNSNLTSAAGGALSLTGASINIQANINIPNGTLSFTALDFSPYANRALGGGVASIPDIDFTRGTVTLGSGANLNVAGMVIDQRSSISSASVSPILTKGGFVTIDAFNVNLLSGTSINVSGGVNVSATGSATYGVGGSFHVSGGVDPLVPPLVGGSFNMNSALEGYSGLQGASLSITAPLVQIGGSSAPAGTLLLTPQFFSTGGFNSFSISGLGTTTAVSGVYNPGISILPNTVLKPIVTSKVELADPFSPTGFSLQPIILPQAARSPVNLSFASLGVRNPYNSSASLIAAGNLIDGLGSVIETDPYGKITLTGDTVTVLGSLFAPGGTITISGGKDSGFLFPLATAVVPTVDLAPSSSLSAKGTVLYTANPLNAVTGRVLNGGDITILGNIAAETGSKIDVSGASSVLDFQAGYSGALTTSDGSTSGMRLIPTRVQSNGGTLTLIGSQELFFDSTIFGSAGGSSAIGGTLTMSSGLYFPTGAANTQTPLSVTMTVSQSGPVIPASFYSTGQTAIGHAIINSSGVSLPAGGYFAASNFNTSGFASLSLLGTPQFVGSVSLTAPGSLIIGTDGVIYSNAAVNLNSSLVSVGTQFASPFAPLQQTSAFSYQGQSFFLSPTAGSGSLNVTAPVINIGNLSLQNISKANFTAQNGDIIGDGYFDVAGSIVMTAGQIYPPTSTVFQVTAFDYKLNGVSTSGAISILGSGTRPLPLSAGGSLNFYASTISQGGTLNAPVGTINLGWNGSGAAPFDMLSGPLLSSPITQQLTLTSGSHTSVSAIDPVTGINFTIPYGLIFNATSWIDPSGTDITNGGIPSKLVNLSAKTVTDQAGSVIDMRGGGDLLAYQWVSGVGGTSDILSSAQSYAIIPSYGLSYAPFGAYNTNPITFNLGSDPGYVNQTLMAGQQVYLQASPGLSAGMYTLLPARYALLPGAFLITPQKSIPIGSPAIQPDGSTVVSGYFSEGLNSTQTSQPLYTSFDVASSGVVASRAQYNKSLANTFLSQSAIASSSAVPRLPIDSGQLIFTATQGMAISGSVTASATTGGLGGLVDIASPVDILITGTSSQNQPGLLVLSASTLSAFSAESLLIGGKRSTLTSGTQISVDTNNLTVNNAGTALTATDVILVANGALTLTSGSIIQATGAAYAAPQQLLIGTNSKSGSGNGALVEVTAGPASVINRLGVNSTSGPNLSVASGVKLTGASVTLDSTLATSIDPSVSFTSQSISLASGQIQLELTNPGTVPNITGLTLLPSLVTALQSTQSLSLLSYSTLDIYGTGQFGITNSAGQPTSLFLGLSTGEIRGFNAQSGTVNFNAQTVKLNNIDQVVGPSAMSTASGTLAFNATTIDIGSNALFINQYGSVALNATQAIVLQSSGSLNVVGNLTANTPLVTASAGVIQTLSATQALNFSGGTTAVYNSALSGLGANLNFVGSSVAINNAVFAPSGSLLFHATSGSLLIGNTAPAQLNVSGQSAAFFDLQANTNAGTILLTADQGSVSVGSNAVINVAAQASGGNAGSLHVSAPQGSFGLSGTLSGLGAANAVNASFSLDEANLSLTSVDSLDTLLFAGGFTESLQYRLRTGDVTIAGLASAKNYSLAADTGSITVASTGYINASGVTGGTIDLQANGNVTLQSGARLSVAAQNFNNSGRGGLVNLFAGSELNGVINPNGFINVLAGSNIDLSVASFSSASSGLGNLTGVLHIRAPQNMAGSDLQVNSLKATIVNPSSIILEGYNLYNLTSSGGIITSKLQDAINSNGQVFGSNTGSITNRLLGANSNLTGLTHVQPGAEIINTSGDITLSTAWDFSTYRYGPSVNSVIAGSGEPGNLVLKALGNINFAYAVNSSTGQKGYGSLSDGFGGSSSYGLWDQNLLPAGSLSWSYQLTSGADFNSANLTTVLPLSSLAASSGSILLGLGSQPLPLKSISPSSGIIPSYYQVIRTGTGSININAGRDLQLLNSIATIYTAGTQIANPTTVIKAGDFSLPNLSLLIKNSQLGAAQLPIASAQFSMDGGNVTIFAQQDITHQIVTGSPVVTYQDSSLEMPNNWLYRQGYVNPATGLFASSYAGGPIQSTAWWVNFTNFFEGVGALGGGNVILNAGRDISNIDAVVPTNARMAAGIPNSSNLVELGGGNLTVLAGRNINAGVYYVEHGAGVIQAGGSIFTNSTRAAITQSQAIQLQSSSQIADQSTWLPTTLFLGKGSFQVNAGGDLLLGPIANPFLMPSGLNNNAYEKSYFSTYASTDSVSVKSLTGDITLLDSPADNQSGSLFAWYQNVLLYDSAHSSTFSSYSQPWLRLTETTVLPFQTVMSIMPPTLDVNAFTGSINIIGSLVLSPSSTGQLNLAANKSINGMQSNGETVINGLATQLWNSSLINLSDADPTRIPSALTPLNLSSADALTPTVTPLHLMDNLDSIFSVSGSTTGSSSLIQTKEALHAPGPLHFNDPLPVHLYASNGSISGLTLFSGKVTDVVAGLDITDIGLYIQNVIPSNVSIVDAGRDLIAYNPNSLLRLQAQYAGNRLLPGNSNDPGPLSGNPTSGDIQISGPGTLEVLAGRNLTLGVGPNAIDGTARGITSIGNTLNPYLPFVGSDVITGAGIGAASSLNQSQIGFTAFIADFLNPSTAGNYSARYLPDLGKLMGMTSTSTTQIWNQFNTLSIKQKDIYALDIFYLVLRDAGRDHNNKSSPGYGNYTAGYAAISALFPAKKYQGYINLTSKEIMTASGGNINIFAPGGYLTVGINTTGNPAVDQGILTEYGGNISIFTQSGVNVGTSRIFTLRGGNETLWSTTGDIAAGESAKTVQSAPPTRVLIDPQSGAVETDLAGLATGGGIGVLETVAGIPPADVDLIAPSGSINAGDAGIRASGNLTLSAVKVINAGNIQVGGATVGSPMAAAPSMGGSLAAASGASAAASSAAADVVKQSQSSQTAEDPDSEFDVEVLGYGGGGVAQDPSPHSDNKPTAFTKVKAQSRSKY